MSPRERTGTGTAFRFTDDDRAKLIAILKVRDDESVQLFLNDVETEALRFSAQANAVGPESSVAVRRVLKSLAAKCRDLRELLDDQLEWGGSYDLLLLAAAQQGDEVDADKMMNDLFWMETAANTAIREWLIVQRGRAPDWLESTLVTKIAERYLHRFGKLPPHSPTSSFSVFISEIFHRVCPDSPHKCQDNSKFLKAAIANVRHSQLERDVTL